MWASMMARVQVRVLISILVICLTSCSKDHSTGNASESVEAKPFNGEIYRTIGNTRTITLTSPDELELSGNGVNLLCKYTKQTETLRVVANIAGTSQALYFRIIPEGLRANDGTLYLAPQIYTRETRIAEKKKWFTNEFLKSFDAAKVAGRLDEWIAAAKKAGMPTGENGEPPKWETFAAQHGWQELPK